MAYVSPRGFFNRDEVGSTAYRPLPRRRSPLVQAIAGRAPRVARAGGLLAAPFGSPDQPPPSYPESDLGAMQAQKPRYGGGPRLLGPPVERPGGPGFLGPPAQATPEQRMSQPIALGPPIRRRPPRSASYPRRRGIVNSILGL